MGADSRRLTRATHQKSRKGCLTCKARHVKCDETRPECLACQRLGKKCEGFPDEKDLQFRWRRKGDAQFIFKNTFCPSPPDSQPSTTSGPSLSSRSSPPLVEPPPLPSPLTMVRREALPQDEASAWEYFTLRTVPLLSSFFQSDLWTQSIPCMSEAAPAIKHTLLAIGAWHAEEDLLIAQSPTAMVSIPRQGTFPLKQYGKALQALSASMSNAPQGNESRTVALFACLLFVVFESLRGQSPSVRMHLKHGLQICREGLGGRSNARERALVELMLGRMGIMNAMFDNDPTLLSGAGAHSLLDVSESDESLPRLQLFAARIHNISNDVYRFVWKVGNECFADAGVKYAAQADIQARLDDWLQDVQSYDFDTSSSAGNKILWARYELARTMLQTSPNLYQTTYDLHTPAFETIIDLISSALQRDPDRLDAGYKVPKAFSVDSGIIALLAYTARLCRHPQLRRRAVELLQYCPRREGIWSSHVAIASSNIVIEFEERAALGIDDNGLAIIPEEARVHLLMHQNVMLGDTEQGDSPTLDLVLTVRSDPASLGLTHVPLKGVVVAEHLGITPMTL